MNGNLTLGENIADNGGLKEAYYAYESWLKRNGEEPILPGFASKTGEYYTSKQMFWISYANSLCTKYHPSALRNSILTDTHSPLNFQVIGPITNMPEFSEDFKCPLGSYMNPVKKCTLW